MKRIVIVALAILMLLSGCGSKPKELILEEKIIYRMELPNEYKGTVKEYNNDFNYLYSLYGFENDQLFGYSQSKDEYIPNFFRISLNDSIYIKKYFQEQYYNDNEKYNKVEIYNKKNNKIIGVYDNVIEFSEDLVLVRIDNKWGLIDKKGKEIIAPKYDSITYTIEDKYVLVEINNKWGIIDKKGKEIVTPKYESVRNVSEGMAVVEMNDKCGVIDISGKEIVIPKYDSIASYREGMASVKIDNKFGFIDIAGKEIVTPKYDEVYGFIEGMSGVEENGKWGFIDKTGEEIVIPKYDSVNPFTEGMAFVEENDKYGFIDLTGREIVSPKYDFVSYFSEGMARVKKNGKYGFIDKTGEEIIPLKYDSVGDFSKGMARVRKSGKRGLINKTGEEIIAPKYDNLGWFLGGLIDVEVNNKWGIIDEKGKEIIFGYDSNVDLPSKFLYGKDVNYILYGLKDGKPYYKDSSTLIINSNLVIFDKDFLYYKKGNRLNLYDSLFDLKGNMDFDIYIEAMPNINPVDRYKENNIPELPVVLSSTIFNDGKIVKTQLYSLDFTYLGDVSEDEQIRAVIQGNEIVYFKESLNELETAE